MRTPTVLVLAASLFTAACGDPGATGGDAGGGGDAGASACQLGTLPTTYDGTAFETNAKEQRELAEKIEALIGPMEDADTDLMKKPTAVELKALFEPLRASTTPEVATRIDAILEAVAAGAGQTWTPAMAPGSAGGTYGKYLFTKQGLHGREVVEKMLYGALLYPAGAKLMAGAITPATVDQVLALFGAHPSFPGNDKDPNHPDEFAAEYAERRDKKDVANPGPYLRIKANLIKARAAAAKDSAACQAEAKAALEAVRVDWELALVATFTTYMNATITNLGKAMATDDEKASALHAYSEAVGFVAAFRGTTAPRRITDAQIDEILAAVGSPTGGESTAYKLATETATELPKLTVGINKLAAIYGFTPAQIEEWKTSY